MNGEPHRFQLGEVACSTHTIAQLLDELRRLLEDKALRPRTVLTVNAHIFNLAVADAALRRSLNAARVVTADGMSVVWAARLFGFRIAERCNMTEAFRAFLTTPGMPPSRALLIGCTSDEAEAAAACIHRLSRHCRVIRTCSGYLSDSEYREICAQHTGADFIFLGMGTPRTERVASVASETCPDAIVWGIGGGTVRILAGTLREAPVLWRRLGLQWAYRLFSEPGQLWRRYLMGNPLFVWRILKAARRRRRSGRTEGPAV